MKRNALLKYHKIRETEHAPYHKLVVTFFAYLADVQKHTMKYIYKIEKNGGVDFKEIIFAYRYEMK